jgi:hypothetical protein
MLIAYPVFVCDTDLFNLSLHFLGFVTHVFVHAKMIPAYKYSLVPYAVQSLKFPLGARGAAVVVY